MIKDRETKKLLPMVRERVEENILDLLIGKEPKDDRHSKAARADFRHCLRIGEMEHLEVPYEPRVSTKKQKFPPSALSNLKNLSNILAFIPVSGPQLPKQNKKTSYTVKDVRALEEEAETQRILSEEVIIKRAIRETEEYGIVFIDELDKIAGGYHRHHADASDEGVQRDLLPIIEGTKINTDYGDVDTSKILFIAAGAFHQAKPSDLLAELQGRLPIRVQLTDLTEENLYRILVEPEAHSIKQQRALLKTENVDLRFTDEAVREIAKITYEVNQSIENIGARRLNTVLEKVLEDVSFNASSYKGKTVIIGKEDVQSCMKDLRKSTDLKQYIL